MIIDCTSAGNENKEKCYNRFADSERGFIAQGSEFGFGKMYAQGINDAALDRNRDRFIQVVSCNTQNLAALIDTIALGREKENNLEEARFVWAWHGCRNSPCVKEFFQDWAIKNSYVPLVFRRRTPGTLLAH